MNHERNKAQAAYLYVMERAPAHEGAPFSIEKGSFRNLLTGGALFLMRARPFQLKGLFQKFAQRGHALSHEGVPFSIKRALLH